MIEDVSAGDVTDVFVISHGWKGDTPAAGEQYDAWVGRMAAQTADIAAFRIRDPGLRPLVVGLHWPSLPWGDERLPEESADGLLGEATGTGGEATGTEDEAELDRLVDSYAARTADTPAARTALRTILAADVGGTQLDPRLEHAYLTLFDETSLASGTSVAAPGDDQEGFDPRAIIDEAADGVGVSMQGPAPTAPGLLGVERRRPAIDLLRTPLRQLSFWSMKKRGREFGESGAHRLVVALQTASPAVRVHLMGHSFGCIVVSGAVVGPPGGSGPARPVQTLYLVQGAMSLWSFGDDVPHERGAVGYFRRILADGLVEGPLVTTRSVHDTALGVHYPRGAQVAGHLLLGEEFPAFGALGTFGAQGVAGAADAELKPPHEDYSFAPGSVWNLDASHVVSRGSGPSGAHSDLDHDELAHAFWQAALTTTP
ncbi:MAG TPA: hypothetical protein VI248_02245 [Kineosporiaceae bacterium]